MDFEIKGKRAVVFGGSKGLGRAVAQALVAEGAKVAIVSRDATNVKQTVEALGVVGLNGDVSVPGTSETLLREAAHTMGGPVDILVINTGGPAKGSVETLTVDDWQAAFNNLWLAAVESITTVLPGMKEAGWGRILVVTSIAAKEPQSGLLVSNSLRAGLLGMINSLSKDISKFGITINALMPGYTATDRMKELGVDAETFGARIPAGRLGKPSEFGAVAAFLASNQASYVTGQAIAIDGGYLNSI
ncbi:SDR family oxidoreductase [Mesorhizobium sp. AaZ16]|uniref:SDR family oxidoreductase n=1 Tax=Mesorhizobium sp. AaZ16 TaxID=3402289 RepID=UPI00374FC175